MATAHAKLSTPDQDLDPNLRAVLHLLDEFKRARGEKNSAERQAQFAETIRLLAPGLKVDDRGDVLRRLKLLEDTPSGRGGEAFGKILAFVRRDPRKTWTVAEIQDALGPIEDAKAIYNAIAYLASSGRLRRISRGRYAITEIGAGVEYDGRDDGTERVSENDA